jgi:hypothetical protein
MALGTYCPFLKKTFEVELLLQAREALKLFTTPKHGSVNVVSETSIEHDERPTHAAETKATLEAALHDPFEKPLPQLPVGVP